MSIIWLKFPDEVLSSHSYSEDTKKGLENIFSNQDTASPWLKALSLLGIKTKPSNEPMIYWYQDTPYFNWACYMKTISGGYIDIKKTGDGGYEPFACLSIKSTFSMISIQWKITRFLSKTDEISDKLVESIALGIALQCLILRLEPDGNMLSKWLSDTSQTPKKHLDTIKKIQAIQIRRTEITNIWYEHLKLDKSRTNMHHDLPDFFWSDDIPSPTQQKTEDTTNENQTSLHGQSVCAGGVTGIGIIIDSKTDKEALSKIKSDIHSPLILIFKFARPETTELFEYASGLIFCNGGALSHACTIARQMNIPSITSIGNNFYNQMQSHNKTINLHLNATDAEVTLL